MADYKTDGQLAYEEIVDGRNGRKPLLVRMELVERITSRLVYISTAVLIAVIVGVGGLVFELIKTGTAR